MSGDTTPSAPHPHPAQWPRCRLLTEHSVRVLSAESTLISALDRGWRFRFLSSASLFALSLESLYAHGRKCSRADQIRVWVTFVPGQPRKCRQPGRFSRTELVVHFKGRKPGRQACRRSFRSVLCVHLLRSRKDEWSCLVWLPAISENSPGWPFPRGLTLGSDRWGPWLTFVFCWESVHHSAFTVSNEIILLMLK